MHRSRSLLTCAVVVLLVTAGVAFGQQRPGPGPLPINARHHAAWPNSEFDAYGIQSPLPDLPTQQQVLSGEVPYTLSDCTSSPCDFTNLPTKTRTENIRFASGTGYPMCQYDIDHTNRLIFDQTVTPTADYVELTWGNQSGVGAGQASTPGLLTGLTLVCVVSQGAQSFNCPGTTALPYMIRQDTAYGSHLSFTSYHTIIGTDSADPIRFQVWVRSSDTTNNVLADTCYDWFALQY
jgi:hypothetical protein